MIANCNVSGKIGAIALTSNLNHIMINWSVEIKKIFKIKLTMVENFGIKVRHVTNNINALMLKYMSFGKKYNMVVNGKKGNILKNNALGGKRVTQPTIKIY